MHYLKPVVHMNSKAVAVCLAAGLSVMASTAMAQSKSAYRCPSVNGVTHFTDNKAEADRLGCTVVTGGNVTVIEGTKVSPGPASNNNLTQPVRVATAPQAGSRIDGAEQRSRDSDSRSILESELKKAEARQAELLKEYNNGEPAKIGGENQNYQKYLDRVAEMKANIARNDSDIAGIKREIGRTSNTRTQ